MLTRSLRRSISSRVAPLQSTSVSSGDVLLLNHGLAASEMPGRLSMEQEAEKLHQQQLASTSSSQPQGQSFVTFLRKKPSTTMLPIPESSTSNALDVTAIFQTGVVTEQTAIMHACLYNAFDVPRARLIFNRMRSSAYKTQDAAPPTKPTLKKTKAKARKTAEPAIKPHAIFSIQTYEAFLKAYQMLAMSPSPPMQTLDTTHSRDTATPDNERRRWSHEFWSLFEVLLSESEGVYISPAALELAFKLSFYEHPHSIPESSNTNSTQNVSNPDPEAGRDILSIPPSQLLDIFLSSSPITSISISPTLFLLRFPELRSSIIHLALDRGNVDLIRSLQSAPPASAVNQYKRLEQDDMEAEQVDRTVAKMEEIMIKPVVKRKTAGKTKSKEDETAEELADELADNVPYNLELLRKMLEEMQAARKMLDSASETLSSSSTSSAPTPSSIQRTLESLTALTALTRLRHESETMTSLEMGGERGLRRGVVRDWVRDWAKGIEKALEADQEEARKWSMQGLLDDPAVGKGGQPKKYNVMKRTAGGMTEWGRDVGKVLRGESDAESEAGDELPTSSGAGWLPGESTGWTMGMPDTKNDQGLRKGPPISPFLALLPNTSIAHITVSTMLRMYGSGGVQEGMKLARAVISLGRAIEEEVMMIRKMEKERKARKERRRLKKAVQAAKAAQASGEEIAAVPAEDAASVAEPVLSTGEMPEWTQAVRGRVGAYLVDKLLQVATIRVGEDELAESHPAFYHSYDYYQGRRVGVIRVHPKVVTQMSKEPPQDQLYARHLPMLVPPRAWVGEDEGGYLFSKTSVMRYKESMEQQVYTREAASKGHMELVFSSLDVLGSTPWKINRFVFDTMLDVWNSGKGLAKVPPETLEHLVDPPMPEEHTDPAEKSKFIATIQSNAVQRANNHSERCNVNYKLEIAKAFINDTFYFPHNVDFRGRAYPIPPHLNHMGDDLSRGLLLFADAKELGEEGLRWVKIHLAGLYGYDKASFQERVEWVHTHLDLIRDSAENPLSGQRWWVNADDPWQCLATCKELISALDSPDPTKFKSSLPVHQDGTCNGLQHYAALGGDLDGARQVNLVDSDRPSDVYTHVASLVEKMIDEDVEKGTEVAKLLQGKISRKVVKQTVMTTVYGVTFIGARDQIGKQLKDKSVVPADMVWDCSSYLAKKVLYAIGNLFSGAKGIMTWFSVCARLISKSLPPDRFDTLRQKATSITEWTKGVTTEQMTSVIWTTPLGLPVVQPYRRLKKGQLRTGLQAIYISNPREPAEVNSSKQASAFPPNFIHSLDATHMMLTSLECRANGITYASVHDSYWTHASTIGQMSSIIRDTFVSLHSSHVMSRLQDEFRTRYKDFKVPLTSIRSPNLYRKLKAAGTTRKGRSKRIREVEGSATSTSLNVDGVMDEMLENEKVEVDTILEAMDDGVDAERSFAPESEFESDSELELESESDDSDSEASIPNARHPLGLDKARKLYTSIAPDPCLREQLAENVEEGKGKSNLGSSFSYFYLTDLLPPLPKKGSFDVGSVRGSGYFFS